EPAGLPPNVGNAGFGALGSTTRGVPSQLGAVHVPMLDANGVYVPGTTARPLVAPNAITGMSMFAAWVRFSMSRRFRPTESADESRLIACEQSASAAQDAPTFPTEHVPEVQTPVTDVTLRPAFG